MKSSNHSSANRSIVFKRGRACLWQRRFWNCPALLCLAWITLSPTGIEAQVAPGVFSSPHLPSGQIADVFRAQRSARDTPAPPSNSPALPRDSAASPGNEAAPAGDSASAGETDREAEIASDIATWIDQLGSSEFAIREKATARLRETGKPALPALNQIAAEYPDPEVRMRARDVAEGITGGETAGRLDAFLMGKDADMDGWDVARTILGDGVRIRELYVDLLMRHADVAAALDATTAERQAAFQSTIIGVQRGMFVEGRLPTEADLIALILLANDHDMAINRVEEEAVFTVLRREATNKLLTDAQLSGPFRALLGGWISRENVTNRQEMLWFSLSWDLAETLTLATQTLQKSTDPVTLSMAMQAIARFGDRNLIGQVAKFLDDERPASEQQYSGGALVQAQVRDAAAATIILLSDRKLSDFSMNDQAPHPKYGFIVPDIGFPTEDPQPRKLAIEKIKKELLAP